MFNFAVKAVGNVVGVISLCVLTVSQSIVLREGECVYICECFGGGGCVCECLGGCVCVCVLKFRCVCLCVCAHTQLWVGASHGIRIPFESGVT